MQKCTHQANQGVHTKEQRKRDKIKFYQIFIESEDILHEDGKGSDSPALT